MSDVISNGIDNYFVIVFDLLSSAFFNLLDYIMQFFFSGFDTAGKTIITSGDIMANHFANNGFTSFTNFMTVFVGFVFVSWAVKTAWKIVTKIIEIVGNYIPFT